MLAPMRRRWCGVSAGGLTLLFSSAASSQSPSERIVSIALGYSHTCVLLGSGDVRCWGQDQALAGRVSGKHVGDDETPALADDVDLGGKAVQISAGGGQTCALLDTGKVRCWGGNGVNGYGGIRRPSLATPAELGDLELGTRIVEISAGTSHQCARTELGTVRCFGEGQYGELGYGSRKSVGGYWSPALTRDVPIGNRAASVVAGRFQSCALLGGALVRCWGNEEPVNGPVQHLDDIDKARPADSYPVFDLGAPVRQISAGGPICVLLLGGRVRCWGRNESGELGYGHKRAIASPAAAADVRVGGPVLQITTGVAHVCALLSEGRVRCWGRGADGALGYGNGLDIGDDETPDSAGDVPVGGRVVQIAAGGFHTCALLEAGKVRCWGDSRYGQLGYASIQRVGDTETPAQVGDVQVFPSDPATPPPKRWASQAPPAQLPLLWERQPQKPKTEECPGSCLDCKLVLDGARSLRAARQAKPRRLSAREQALFRTAYRQYLESSICLGYDQAPQMDFRAIGSAQDPARVHAVLDAAFTAPGRAQTLIVATVDNCGGEAARFVWARSLAILLEKDELVSISLLFGWDRAWARDLNGDGISELVGLMRSSLITSDLGDHTELQVASYAGGQEHPLASVDADMDGCMFGNAHSSWQIWSARGEKDGALCFRSRQSSLACPKARR
jgi:alpha-tubulin suppressor-like RCC1 family protein